MSRRDLLFSGRLGLLAAHVAARRLAADEATRVHLVVGDHRFDEMASLVRGLLPRDDDTSPEPSARADDRLGCFNPTAVGPEVELWHFADFGTAPVVDPSVANAVREAGVAATHLVSTPFAGGPSWRRDEPGVELDFRWRFTTGWTLPSPDGVVLSPPAVREGLLRLAHAVLETQTEVEERFGEYFDYYALRCLAPGDARVRPIRADRAAEVLVALATGTDGGEHSVASPREIGFGALLEAVGGAFAMSLLATSDPAALNPVDRSLGSRLGDLSARLAPLDPEAVAAAARAAGVAADELAVSDDELDDSLDAVTDAHRRRLRILDRLDAELEPRLETHRLERAGHPLVYRAIGAGEPAMVVINALGQGLGYWHRLVEETSRRRRVIAWDLRGVLEPPEATTIPDHVDDLAAILDHAGVRSAHLVAWCTGPRIAVELARRQQERIVSMVFLNTTLKATGGSGEMDTDYERNFEPLCRALEGRPAMAASVTSSLAANAAGNAPDPADLEGEPDLVGLLESVPERLRPLVRRPFRDPNTVLAYVHQLLDLWRHDLAGAGELPMPVLCVGAGHDRIAHPEASRRAAARMPRGRWLHVDGASHYLLHDRAESLSDLLETFFADPDAVGEAPTSSPGPSSDSDPVVASP